MEQLESRKIALRYARALFEAAQETNEMAYVTENIGRLRQLYQDVPEMNAFFQNPMIPASEKRDLIETHFKQNLSPMIGNFLNILIENDRVAVLQEILEAYIEMVREKEGIVQAEVTVPVELEPKLEQKLQSTLESLFGYQQVEIKTIVDPAIIAGAVVKIGDKIIDGSYHGKLETLRRQVG